jgi:prepilin-type processing-associated H-X9-DG protein
MEENLVGYLLDCLDEQTKSDVEAHLQASPDTRAKLARLRRALEPLAADKEAASPPPDLVIRTLTRVAEHICSRTELPKAPTLRFESAPTSRRWWRRVDVLIAAGLLLTMLGGLFPALLRLRTSNAMLACQNNLRQFYVALQTYRDQHADSYPDFEKLPEPRNVAGMVVPILAEAGVLPASASIRCPGNGSHLACQLTLADLRAMTDAEFQEHAPHLSLSYAYSLGYRDEAGGYHSAGPNPNLPGSLVPLMGDRVFAEDAGLNSVNHGGSGQNILYSDGHVRFCTARTIAGDDLYLNIQNEVAAGLGAHDAVLGASSARP